MATNIYKRPLSTLEESHRKPLKTIVQRILSTQRAEYVLAQVADSLPTKDSAKYKRHAIEERIETRLAPTAEGRGTVRAWKEELEANSSNIGVDSLEIEAEVLERYQQSTLRTREFKLHLIEIVAIAIHTLAAQLFAATNKPPYKCPAPRPKVIYVDGWPKQTDELAPSEHESCLFHDDYLDIDLYSMGVADIVGYWAETHLFGGVVVSDHGKEDTEFLEVFLHPDSNFKVFRLSDTQIDAFIAFGLYGEPTFPFDFPIKAERDAVRLLPELTLGYNIYRSRNDRHPEELPQHWRPPCVQWGEDDPVMMEFIKKCNKGELRKGVDYN
ncbi:hypothetical protein BJY01DRAFT_250444 [Aspergillus pseudoustus]|uniref:Aminoglycoside phosphotransferase domain-containing protein n=1 Tax=Aspergillus pseudoustus TaxID=1810923 RepID=A0ABR4JKI9_9EURO